MKCNWRPHFIHIMPFSCVAICNFHIQRINNLSFLTQNEGTFSLSHKQCFIIYGLLFYLCISDVLIVNVFYWLVFLCFYLPCTSCVDGLPSLFFFMYTVFLFSFFLNFLKRNWSALISIFFATLFSPRAPPGFVFSHPPTYSPIYLIESRLLLIYQVTDKFKMWYSHPHPPTHPSTFLPTNTLSRYLPNPTYMTALTCMIATPLNPQWAIMMRK